jgi:CheY-like chemotaxis protein
VTLDIHLPDIEGWRVLDRIKHDPVTRHIPVAVVSTDDARGRALASGAFAFLAKPVATQAPVRTVLERLQRVVRRGERTLLAVGADPGRLDWFANYLAADDVHVLLASDAAGAREHLARHAVDCIVWDAALALAEGDDFGQDAEGDAEVPVPLIVFGERAADARCGDGRALGRMVVVHAATTPEALLDRATFLLHRVPARMSEAHRSLLREIEAGSEVLSGRRVMVVDDDMRNIFALTSLLEDRGVDVVAHDNGRAAIAALDNGTRVDAILMDIMMPEMDGFATIRAIRRNAAHRDVPIIAVTAKAMKGDREKCMEAGAWDYISKPVDPDLMVGVLRAWLSR